MLLKDSKTKNTGRSIVWGVANKLLAIFLPFIVRTEIIYFLGVEYTGLGSLFTSILTVLSLAELGFGSAIVFSMYKPVAENDIKKINAYLYFYKKCYTIIGFIVLGIGLLILPFLQYLINGECPNTVNLYVLYIIYLLNTVLSYFMYAYKTSILYATQRNDIVSIISSVVLVITNILQIILLVIFRNYYVYVIVMPIMTIVNNIIISRSTKRVFPELKAQGEIDDKEKQVIYLKLRGLIFQQIGSIVLASSDTLVISAVLGLTTLGIYNNYYYILSALFGFFAVIQTSLYPTIGNSMQTESVEKNYSDFRFFHFLYIACVIFCTACLVSLYQPFMKVWVGEKLMLDMPLVLLLAVYFYTYKMSDICSVYRYATGMFEIWKMVPFIAGVFNLTLNIILTKYMGLYGVVLSTIAAMVFIYLPFYCYPVINKCFKQKKRYAIYLITQLLYMVSAFLISLIVYFCSLHINIDGIGGLSIKAFVVVTLAGTLVIAMIYISPYRSRVLQMFIRIMKRK